MTEDSMVRRQSPIKHLVLLLKNKKKNVTEEINDYHQQQRQNFNLKSMGHKGQVYNFCQGNSFVCYGAKNVEPVFIGTY